MKYILYLIQKIKKKKEIERSQYVFLSFPKAGRTWIRHIFGIFQTLVYPQAAFSLDFQNSQVFHKILFTHAGSGLGSKKGYNTDKKIQQLMHSLTKKHVCFFVRDPRDVVVSYYFQAKYRKKNKNLWKDMTIQEFMKSDTFGISKIISFYNYVYSVQHIFSQFYMVRYEDIKKDSSIACDIIQFFLKPPYQIDQYREYALQAYEESKFEKMKEKEAQQAYTGIDELQPANIDNPESYKVRKGKVAGYVDYFSHDDIMYMNTAMKQLHPIFGYTE